MNKTLYIRPHLPATRNRIADPERLIEDWVSDLQMCLDKMHPQGSAHEAYYTLALWARLRRVDPGLLARCDEDNALQQAEALVRRDAARLCADAMAVPYPPAWMKQAMRLADSYENLIDPVERSALAEELIRDLDDADLAVYAVQQLKEDVGHVPDELQECHRHLREEADTFMAAAVYIQAVGLGLRADLPQMDPALATTAEKYDVLLDAVEDMDWELSFAGQIPLAPHVRQRLLKMAAASAQTQDEPTIFRFPLRDLPDMSRMAVAAFAPSPAVAAVIGPDTPMQKSFQWRHPEGELLARLMVPRLPLANRQVLLTFRNSNRSAATQLRGKEVELAGVATTIDEEGNARFRYGDLKNSSSEYVSLIVDGVEWSGWTRD